MKRWGKWGILAITGIGVIAFASRFVVSQPAAQGPTAPNVWQELFAKAQPAVEEALGSRLDQLPTFCLFSMDGKFVYDEYLDGHLRWHFPQIRGESGLQTLRAAQRVVGRASLACNIDGKNAIAVFAEEQAKIAARDGDLAAIQSEAFLQLALVQEVVRWHLHQRYPIAQLRASCRDGEEFETLMAIVEGRVQWVTRQIAEKLGSQALFPVLAKCYLHVPDDGLDPAIRAVSQTALHARFRACTQGLAFWDGLTFADAEQRIFAHPPRQLTVLARPDRWQEAQLNNQPDLASVLQAVELAASAEWQPMQQTWTPAMLMQVVNMLGASKERAEKVAQSWYEGRTLLWTPRSRPDKQIALSVVRHDSDAGARGYFSFAVDLQRKQDTLPPGTCGPTMRVVESKSVSVALPGFDEAVRNDKRIAFGEAEAIPVSLLLARRGNLVIECTWHGLTFDAGMTERLIGEVSAAAK